MLEASRVTVAVTGTAGFTVNSTVDTVDANAGNGVCETSTPGECTLRAAIMEANANFGLDNIAFTIPTTGALTIQPLSALPTITDPVVIDGYTQPGASPNTNGPGLGSNAVLMIELDGSLAGVDVNGLHITAGSSTVRGLVINRFSRSGILLDSSGDNVIAGNFLGTDVTGTAVTEVVTGPPTSNFTVTALSETSATYPADTDFDGFVSQSGDPIAPWSGTSVHFLGTDVGGSTEMLGGSSLVYRYRLEFDEIATLTSISVSGAAFNGGRI